MNKNQQFSNSSNRSYRQPNPPQSTQPVPQSAQPVPQPRTLYYPQSSQAQAIHNVQMTNIPVTVQPMSNYQPFQSFEHSQNLQRAQKQTRKLKSKHSQSFPIPQKCQSSNQSSQRSQRPKRSLSPQHLQFAQHVQYPMSPQRSHSQEYPSLSGNAYIEENPASSHKENVFQLQSPKLTTAASCSLQQQYPDSSARRTIFNQSHSDSPQHLQSQNVKHVTDAKRSQDDDHQNIQINELFQPLHYSRLQEFSPIPYPEIPLQEQKVQLQYLLKVMANLNFQQAPRSLTSGGVGRVGSSLVGGVSGHVTPTFGGALSPGRSSASMPSAPPSMASRTTLFGQRAFADRRVPIPTPLSQPNSNAMSSMGGVSRFNAGGSYHSVFGEGGDTSTPPLLDLSEFPSLTARGAGDQAPTAAPPPPGTKPYVGMVKQPTAEQSEFTMSSEDFPALPGTSGPGATAPTVTLGGGTPIVPPSSLQADNTLPNSDKPRKGIQTSIDGKVTNIPETMIPNQYGIVGLLTFIRAAESDPSLVSLALGQDLTALGLNLNSPDNLYLTFAGPWADTPCRPQDMDYHVPPEYLINGAIREKLAPLRLSRYKEDLLFYLFYCFVGDVLQIAAAAELYNREWRYHMEEKVWISQAPGMPMVEKTSSYERGTYYFFDAHNWRKVAKEFHLDYSKLEGRPQLPAHPLT